MTSGQKLEEVVICLEDRLEEAAAAATASHSSSQTSIKDETPFTLETTGEKSLTLCTSTEYLSQSMNQI